MALPRIQLRSQPNRLAELVERLKEHNYTEESVAELLGALDVAELQALEYPGYVWKCARRREPLGLLVNLFLLGVTVPVERAISLLGERLMQALERCRLLIRQGDQVRCQAVIYPCLGQMIVTDPWLSLGAQIPGKIYELGSDSYSLARVTSRKGARDCLDLCTGSGVHAVGSALPGVRSTAIDINPRALKFTELNAAINGVTVETLECDLYSGLSDETFDLITANPPFVASPDPDLLIHRSVGETGEEIPERLVAALPLRLREGGVFSMVLVYPVLESETYLDRLQRWLGCDKGWGISVLKLGDSSIYDFIRIHAGGENYTEVFAKYLESYERQGIVGMESANVFIHRLPEGERGWRMVQPSSTPRRNIRDLVERWLDCLKEFSNPDWAFPEGAEVSLSSEVRTVWRDSEAGVGYIEFVSPSEFPVEALENDHIVLADLLGTEPQGWEQLKQRWADLDRSSETLVSALRGLGLRRALEVRAG